jgi:flagellar basal-body rod protein FlgC
MLSSALDISTSALVAQRIRMNAISSNLANMNTPINEAGDNEPYQAKFVIFQTDTAVGENGAAGVKVSSVETAAEEPRWKYQPGHPLAQKEGIHKDYVAYPAVDMMTEYTDALEAARSYEANLGAMEITKDLAQQTLRIIG